jgi:hypothetical protein
VIPTEGSEDSKRPPQPFVSEASDDDETFEDRLRRAIVRHFRFSWTELSHARRAEREKPEPERPEIARPDAGDRSPAEPSPASATASPPSPAASAEITPPPPPGGNGSGPASSSESGPTLPPERPAF